MTRTTDERMKTQSDEFDAMAKLAEQWRRLSMTPVVDDDYPEVRHCYESALREFQGAVQINRPGEGTPLGDVVQLVTNEVKSASAMWPPFNSAHEGYSVLAEEVDELWDEVKVKQKNRDLAKMKKEAIQVAAMAIRFALDVCSDLRGRK